MGKAEFTLHGDLSSGMLTILKAFPKETEKFMRRQAAEFKKFVKERAKADVKKQTGNYLKGFAAGRAVYEWTDADYNIRVYNKSSHNHLIELGHAMVGHRPNKVRVGRVRAYEVMNRAMESWQRRFETSVEDELVDYIIKELER